jgi:hypothetical protein
MGLRLGDDFGDMGAALRGIARDENPAASRSNSASCIFPTRDETKGPFRSTQKHLTIPKEKTTLFCAITWAELSQTRSIRLVASF